MTEAMKTQNTAKPNEPVFDSRNSCEHEPGVSCPNCKREEKVSELLPCPFCGAQLVTRKFSETSQLSEHPVNGCCMSGFKAFPMGNGYKQWNTRPPAQTVKVEWAVQYYDGICWHEREQNNEQEAREMAGHYSTQKGVKETRIIERTVTEREVTQ